LVEKWIPPSRSKIAEIGQKTEGILGVKGGELKRRDREGGKMTLS
jgi:hypothetical protein